MNEAISGGMVSAVSGRARGNMSSSYGDTSRSLRNREEFLGPLGIDYRKLVCCRQVHGSAVYRATEKDRGRGTEAAQEAVRDTDALITDIPGLALAMFTADCLSITLYDPLRRAAAVIHAGWRSTAEGIAARTVDAMRAEFGSDPRGLLAGFGPCMRPCCYEVGPEFAGIFPRDVESRGGRHFFDLAGNNRRRLLGCGIAPSAISDEGRCTCCGKEDFFSYRREGASCGRMMTVVMLK